MGKVFSVEDRENAFRFILSAAGNCSRIVALVQVGSGAEGYRDDRSDLDFVIALDSDESMPEVMDYMHREIAGKYGVLFFRQDEPRHLQCYVLSNLLEIDIGYGGYENAAARKPAFKVLYDKPGGGHPVHGCLTSEDFLSRAGGTHMCSVLITIKGSR